MKTNTLVSKLRVILPIIGALLVNSPLLAAEIKQKEVGPAQNKAIPKGKENKAPVEEKITTPQIIKNSDGSFVQINPDGTEFIKNADGSSIETKSDGSKITTNKDGSSEQINADGTKIFKNSQGTIVK